MTKRVPLALILVLGYGLAGCRADRDAAGPPVTMLLEGRNPNNAQPSPDGTRLLWEQVVEGRSAIFVGNADGSDPVRLTHGVWDREALWSPDGRWIAYLAEGPDYDLYVVPADGGEPRQLTAGPGIDETRMWLPDASGVLFNRIGAGPIHTFVAPLDGDSVRRVGAGVPGSQFVTVSPDRRRATYTWLNEEGSTIWVQDWPDGEPRQLTFEGLEQGSETMWSPDSRSVVFESRRTGTWDLWVIDVESGEARQLTTDIRNDQNAVWSPDGRWIAFTSDRGGQPDIWIIPAAGGDAIRVTNDLQEEDRPHWSADGGRLFFTWSDVRQRLQVQPIAGGEARVLVDWPGYGLESAAVSPDGSTVLFSSNRSGTWDIWSVPFEGGEPTLLASSPAVDDMPAFAPDGMQFAFRSGRGGTTDIWVMPTMGGDAVRITDLVSDEETPRWSPDGQWVAFVVAAGSRETWVVPAGGGDARRVSTIGAALDVPSWAPDSRALYVVGNDGTTTDVFRIPVDGGAPDRLRAHPGVGNGTLSPDGTQFAYATFEGGWGFVEVIPTAGGPARRLTPGTFDVFQDYVAWTPDGSRLIVRSYDFTSDSEDLLAVTWPAGEWTEVTRTPGVRDLPWSMTPDGSSILVETNEVHTRLLSVDLTDLLRTDAN